MPKYDVEVSFIQKKTIQVYAPDEESAEEKASEIVLKWDGVQDVDDTTCLGTSDE
jgi:hypothetical protein